MRNSILILSVVVVGVIGQSCLVNGDKSIDLPNDAANFDNLKICKTNEDCEVIDEDCCNAGEFIATNHNNAQQRLTQIKFDCRRKLAADKDLCKDKKAVTAKPTAECVESQCTIKDGKATKKTDTGPTDEEKAACEYDSQCEVVDKDCCAAGTDLVAINFRSGHLVRAEAFKACKEKKKATPDLCRGVPRASLFNRKIAKCIEKKCTIK